MGMVIGQPPIDTNGLRLYLDFTDRNNIVPIPGAIQTILDLSKNAECKFNGPLDIAYNSNFKSVIFNAYSDYLNAVCKKLDLSKDFTIFVWMNKLSRQPGYYVPKNVVELPNFSYGLSASDESTIYSSTGGGWTQYAVPPDRRWVLCSIAVYRSPANSNTLTIQIYENLSLVSAIYNSYNWPAPSNNENVNVRIGDDFYGHIGMVAIYDRATSLSTFYNATKNRFISPTSTPNVVTNGLVAYLDAGNVSSYSGTGNTWYDLSGNNNHATLNGSPTYNSSSGYLSFNGVNQSATINYSSSLDFSGPQPHTIIIVFRTNPITYDTNYLFIKGGQIAIRYVQGTNIYGTYGSTGYQTVNDGAWMHWSFVYNGLYRTCSRNAYVETSTYGAVSFVSDTSNINICEYMKADIAQILIYKTGLNTGEILQNLYQVKDRFGL